ECNRAAKEGVAGLVGGSGLDRKGGIRFGDPGGQGGAAGPGRGRASGAGAVAGRQGEGADLPDRAVPEFAVSAALQREGRAVGIQSNAAAIIGDAAAETRWHGGGAEGTAARWRAHR